MSLWTIKKHPIIMGGCDFSFDSYKPPARFHVVVNNVQVWLHQVVIEPCS